MPFVFLIVGLMILIIGVRGQSNTAIKLLQSEFTGANSFIQWFLAIMILGLVGYYKPIKPLSDGLIGLVILAMILNEQSQNNIFGALEQAFQNTTPSPATNNNFNPGATQTNGAPSAAAASVAPAASVPNAIPNPSGGFNLGAFLGQIPVG
jgi:hypothetical protein